MPSCCEKPMMIEVNAKCSDTFEADLYHPVTGNLVEHFGYVPQALGVGEGDYVFFYYCGNCGKIDGKWPLLIEEIISTLKR